MRENGKVVPVTCTSDPGGKTSSVGVRKFESNRKEG